MFPVLAWRSGVIAVAMVGGLLAGCTSPEPACGPIVVEQLDPSNIHLLPNAAPPEYLTDPPTSGPHVAGLTVSGRQREPIDPITQVSALEVGIVIVQYGDIADAQRTTLETLASDRVAVAPGRSLPAPVVATGWGRKLRCDGVDLAVLRRFVDQASAEAPGGH